MSSCHSPTLAESIGRSLSRSLGKLGEQRKGRHDSGRESSLLQGQTSVPSEICIAGQVRLDSVGYAFLAKNGKFLRTADTERTSRAMVHRSNSEAVCFDPTLDDECGFASTLLSVSSSQVVRMYRCLLLFLVYLKLTNLILVAGMRSISSLKQSWHKTMSFGHSGHFKG